MTVKFQFPTFEANTNMLNLSYAHAQNCQASLDKISVHKAMIVFLNVFNSQSPAPKLDALPLRMLTCAPSEDSDQPGHPPSLIKVLTVRFMGS